MARAHYIDMAHRDAAAESAPSLRLCRWQTYLCGCRDDIGFEVGAAREAAHRARAHVGAREMHPWQVGQRGISRQHASLTPVHAPCSPWSTCGCVAMITFYTSVSRPMSRYGGPRHDRLVAWEKRNCIWLASVMRQGYSPDLDFMTLDATDARHRVHGCDEKPDIR